jgi:membrane protein
LLLSFSSKGDTITIIGAGVLFIAVVTLFTTLRTIVGNIFEGTHDKRGVIRGYGLDVILAILGGALFLLTFGSSLILDVVDASSADLLDGLGPRMQWLSALWSSVGNLIELLLPLILSTILFLGLYTLIPFPHPKRSSALRGAFSAAVLWELAKRLFSFYVVEFGTFERYSGIGTLGLIVGLVFWTYYSGLVFIVGAMIAALHDERHSTIDRVLPKIPGAPFGLPVGTDGDQSKIQSDGIHTTSGGV